MKSKEQPENKTPERVSAVRRSQEPEDIFYNTIYSLVNNLLINNKNYSNGYYYRKNEYGMDGVEFKEDTIKRAKYILEIMEDIKHLIKTGS